MRRRIYATLSIAAMAVTMASATSLPNDSIANTGGEDMAEGDTIRKSRQNTATGLNALDYLLERRYRRQGELFTKKWYDHLFLEAGAGVQETVPASDDYEILPMTVVHVGLGKQFNAMHTLRLSMSGAVGYQKEKYHRFMRVGVDADWIYSFSSYYGGYNPMRALDISTVLGAGLHYTSRARQAGEKIASEAHVGVQLKFYTGPHAYLVLEPQVGIASDNIDQSGKHNWRKMDFFYGANINFVYFLQNNLSPEQKRRFMAEHPGETTPSQWRMPWFLELAGGINTLGTGALSPAHTIGNSTTASLGLWLSPVVGLRGSGSFTTTAFDKETTTTTSSEKEYINYFHNFNTDIKVEALINPFGFSKTFSWESPFGVYIVAGGGVGLLQKNQSKMLRCKDLSYSVGLKLWARVERDIQLFIEPRYTYYDYKVPYNNVSWSKHCHDDGYGVNVGVALNTRQRKYRYGYALLADDDRKNGIWFNVGLALGTNMKPTKKGYEGSGFGFNVQASAESHFGRLSAARLSFDYMSMTGNSLETTTDITTLENGTTQRKSCRAMWNRRYHLGLLSLNYMLNASNFFAGVDNRRFEIEVFGGPTMMFRIGDSQNLHSNEVVPEGHTYEPRKANLLKSVYGANGGLRLRCNITEKIAATLTPQVYIFKGACNLPGINFIKGHIFETLNLGVEYNL